MTELTLTQRANHPGLPCPLPTNLAQLVEAMNLLNETDGLVRNIIAGNCDGSEPHYEEVTQRTTDFWIALREPTTKLTHDEKLQLLAYLVSQGLCFMDCVRAFGAPTNDPHVIAARQLGGDDVQIDNDTTLSEAEEGKWVMSWLWVSNTEAGVESNDDEQC